MLRFILYSILFLIAMRFVVLVARVLTAGRRDGPRLREEPPARAQAPRPRVSQSDAVDVPFTEIPPDGADASGTRSSPP